MRAAIRLGVLLTCTLVAGMTAQAGVIDFVIDGATQGSDIPDGYPSGNGLSEFYSVLDGNGVRLRSLQWSHGSNYGLSGEPTDYDGVAMDDVDDDSSYWGEIRLEVEDPSQYLVVNSFLIANHYMWNGQPNSGLLIQVVSDDPAGQQQWEFGQFGPGYVDEGGYGKVSPTVGPAKSVTILWNYPYNLGVDNIDFTLVPEPATVVTWVVGLAGFALVGYRRYRRR